MGQNQLLAMLILVDCCLLLDLPKHQVVMHLGQTKMCESAHDNIYLGWSSSITPSPANYIVDQGLLSIVG